MSIVMLIVIALAVIGIFTKKTIKLGSLEISGDSDKIKDKIKSTEDITKQRVKTVMQMRYDLIFRQLKYAENAMEKITHKMCDDYAIFLQSQCKINGDPKDDWAWEMYRCKAEKFIRGNLIAGLRKVYQENHIAEKSELEWLNHKNHITETIHLDLSKFLDDNFYACHGLSRKALEDFHESRWSVLADVIRDCLDQARIMAISTQNEIKQIKQTSKITLDY